MNTNNRIKGNAGEAFVMYQLSKFCYVRPAFNGTDIGIDLYCELLDKENTPFLHFWAQVKHGGASYIKVNEDGTASFSFKRSHLEYWDKQPVPVFVFLVPEDNDAQTPIYPIYIVNISEQLISVNLLDITSNRISLKSDITISDNVRLQTAIEEMVDNTTARMKLKDGIICPTPSTSDTYFKTILPFDAAKYTDKILRTIRGTTAFAIGDIIGSHRDAEYQKHSRRLLTKILEAYGDDGHWEIHYYKAESYILDGFFDRAKVSYQKSIEIIRDDPNTNNDYWGSIIKTIVIKIDAIDGF